MTAQKVLEKSSKFPKCYIETDYVELEGLPDRLDIIGFYKA